MVQSGGAKCFPTGWSVAAKSCDSCKTASALLFCRTDSAFMCIACDAKLHGETLMRHERVWMCEVCDQAPASVMCKADAAALCVTCDRDIHSPNPLARRHERVPVVPFYDKAEAVVKSSAATFLIPAASELNSSVANVDQDNWILPSTNTAKLSGDISPDLKSIELLLSDSDRLLDFEFPIPTDPRLQSDFHNSGTDSVVPVQAMKPLPPPAKMVDHLLENRYEIDCNLHSYNNSYGTNSLSHSVSSSSMDVGIVPEGSGMSDIPYRFMLQMNSSVDLSGTTRNANNTSTQASSQLSGMDREARVLRYREKRKKRKFEKTIRYASRKAYAETRPRIKGRFAKRTDTDTDTDGWFAASAANNCFIGEAEYGVVPSF